MALPNDFNKALHREAGFYAAWFPITMPFAIGDYGLIEGGVFRKIGSLNNLRRDGFDVQILTAQGRPTTTNFMSEGISTVKMVAGATVPELPAANVEAKLVYEFHKKNSFIVKAREINVEQMQNIEEVARQLALMRRESKWSHRYRVVSATYTGQNCLVLLASEAGTHVEFVAAASALKQLDLGDVQVRPSISFSSSRILHNIGDTGVLGLDLFKLSFFTGGVKLMKEAPLEQGEGAVEKEFGDELQDDEL